MGIAMDQDGVIHGGGGGNQGVDRWQSVGGGPPQLNRQPTDLEIVKAKRVARRGKSRHCGTNTGVASLVDQVRTRWRAR